MTTSGATTNITAGGVGLPQVAQYGLISGLNTQAIIAAELQQYEIPINNLRSEQSSISNQISDYQQINSDLLALQTDTTTLASKSGWTARAATSSNTGVATATAANGTPAGSISFTVTQLASSNTLVSSGTVSSPSQIVTSSPAILLSEGGGQLGFQSLADSSGGTALPLGSHTIQVTQASQAASTTGTATVNGAGTTTITTGSNDTIAVTVDGTAYNLTLAASPAGGYTGSALLSAVNQAITAAGAGGALQAGYNASGQLILSTIAQGSSHSLQITGGDALSTLGLSTASSTGVDAVVTVDGTSNTLNNVGPGGSVTLNGAGGTTIQTVLNGSSSQQYANSSLISLGSVTATNVSTGSGSLSDLVSSINASGTGIVASDVQTGSGQYILQLSSSGTGAVNDLSIDTSAFSGSPLGSMRTAVAGQDAQIQVGGPSGYTVSSKNNVFSGLLPGLTITATQVSSSPVTVTVAADSAAIAKSVGQMVTDANTVLTDLQSFAGYNAATKTGGPLMGSATLQNLRNEILATVASTVGTSNLGSAVNAGISISNGALSFDQDKFISAFQANPSQVQSLFTQGGTFSPTASAYAGQVSFGYASATTKPGTYDVQISQSATQASTLGSVLAGGAVSSGETLDISVGSATASYTTTAGQTLASIAAGINAALASQSLSLSAQVVNGNQIELVSTGYGSATSFTVASSNTGAGSLGLTGGSASATFTGTDVAGTINGVAATGHGQFLAAPTTDPVLAGFSVNVTTPGITSLTDLGSITYAPGLAQVLSTISQSMSDPVTGAITTTIKGLQAQSTNINPQIQMYQNMVNEQQQLLMAKYATMEANLNALKSQSTALAGELAQLDANSGTSSNSGSSSGG
ncbi:MAG TPA: flagellar filament capping protein FliD [Acidimicrobiales bacterium]|nr:flagellar filament capping protein FliD [Acidimicrobiales bacterium]